MEWTKTLHSKCKCCPFSCTSFVIKETNDQDMSDNSWFVSFFLFTLLSPSLPLGLCVTFVSFILFLFFSLSLLQYWSRENEISFPSLVAMCVSTLFANCVAQMSLFSLQFVSTRNHWVCFTLHSVESGHTNDDMTTVIISLRKRVRIE